MFEVSTTCHNMPGIQVENPSSAQRQFLRYAMMENRMGEPAYELRSKAGAFLQSDCPDFIMIEFWNPEFQTFVDWLNSAFESWCERARQFGLLED